jgi:thioredoxin reductase (NADPH)
MSPYLIDRIAQQPNIRVLVHSAVRAVGGGRLEHAVSEDCIDPPQRAAGALFVLLGAELHTRWLAGTIALDERGFVVTGPGLSDEVRRRPPWSRLGRDPYLLETSLSGVYAAGDVRSDSVKRVASAVGEGSIAVRFVSKYLGRRADFAMPPPAGR